MRLLFPLFRLFFLTSLFLCGVSAVIRGSAAEGEKEILDLGTRLELFVDDYLIDRLTGEARRELHSPVSREKVLDLDAPWEGIYSAYFTVLHDGEQYRMYYRGMPEAKHDLETEVTCMAVSDDGLQWTKPKLGLYEVKGTRENNVILARHRGCHNFSPFLDRNPDAKEEEKYKALGGTGAPGLIAFVSPDGIHWKEKQAEPVFSKGAFDSQNVAFWSEQERKYVCYFRVFRRGVRWIARTTSTDFVNWSEPLDLEVGEKPMFHHYTNQFTPYVRAPHLYVATPTRFMPGRRALSPEQMETLGTATGFDFRRDCADIVFATSRGRGGDFDRSFVEAFIRPGLDPKNWTSRASYAAHGIFQTSENELSIYVNHNLGYSTAHIRRYSIRPDGFVSVNAPYAGGELLTKPFVFSGNQLQVNFASSAAGGMRFELQNGLNGKALPGFSLEDCDEIIGDQLDRVVRWKGQDELRRFAGRVVRLRCRLVDADLYSIQFRENSDRHASPHFSPEVEEVRIRSSLDHSEQPALFFRPKDDGKSKPLLVALHTWSGNYRQTMQKPLADWCMDRGWAFIHPNFRGENWTPEACGSELAVGDVLDAVAWAKEQTPIDANRILLVGTSGGGHMSLLMAGRTPDVWAGVSAWVPISDLSQWYRDCRKSGYRYADDLVKATGGVPGSSELVDEQYRRRSPLTWLDRARNGKAVIEIQAGITDGHNGSVPIWHSLHAFNRLAEAADRIADSSIRDITTSAKIPDALRNERELLDFSYGLKQPLFRRASGRTRVTVFDGGHEVVVPAVTAWLEPFDHK